MDCMFSNEGVPVVAPVTDTSDEQWPRQLHVNLSGSFFVCEPPCEGRCHDAPHVTTPPARADAIASGTHVTGSDHNWTIGAACAELAANSTTLPNR
jgi:hypothetical protein